MPMRNELPSIQSRSSAYQSARSDVMARVRVVLSDPDLPCVVAFSVIGLLITINVLLWFPGFSETVAMLDLFP